MDENTIYTETGSVKISAEVVQTITAMAINEVEGANLAVSLAGGFVEKLVKKNFAKGIKVEMNEKEVTVEVHIILDYGVKIQPIAAALQELVKRNIETMTDLTVTKVDVYADGINIAKENKKEEPVKEETEE